MRPKGASKDGFTLVEVLVAMAILGTVVISMMALMTSQARTLSDIEEKVFAGIVAENVLAQTMAARQSPNISVTSGEEQLAGRDWAWTQNVTRHEDLPLLQISVVVTRAEQPQVLSTLTALRGSE
ncbi:MAG: type II secretion system minor pseudopilin GspI [Parvularculaceae bacterium]